MTTTYDDTAPTTIATFADNDQAVIEDIERKLKRTRSPKSRIRLTTLLTINRIRAAAGKEALMDMPRGKRGDSLNCPIYNALKDLGVDGISGENGATFVGASSGEDHWLTEAGPSLNGGGDHTIESWHVDEYGEASLVLTGTEFSDFVGAFDGGAYPDLAFSEED